MKNEVSTKQVGPTTYVQHAVSSMADAFAVLGTWLKDSVARDNEKLGGLPVIYSRGEEHWALAGSSNDRNQPRDE